MAGYTYFDIGENTGLKGRVYWQSTSNGSNANSSNVYARVEAMKTNAATTGTFTGDVNIDWNAYGFSWYGTLPVNSWVTLKEASRTVGHNSDGTRVCFVGSTVRGPDGTSLEGISINGSIDATLDTIPRYTSITSFTATSYSETQIKLDYTTADTVSKVEYTRTADVAQPTWITITNDLNAKSGSYIISNLNHNTTYNQIKLRVTRRDSGLTTTSEKKSASTYDYPYSTSAPTFTIGNSFKVKFYNPKSRPITYKIIETRNNTEILTGTTSVASNVEVTINTNTTAIKNKLYENIAQNGSSNTYKVKTIYSSGTAVHSDATGTYNINTTECKPTFTNFAYKDITDNDLTTAIGNNQVLVQGVSSVNLVISSANKMVPKRNATAKSYQYTFNNLNGTVNYSANDIDTNIGVINGSGNQVFSVIANDNRNPSLQSDAVTKTINIIPYALATINVDLHRVNNFEAETKLKLSGTFSRVTVNNADKNLIKTCQYRYKETGTSSWGNWTAITIASQGNGSYETNEATLTLDNSKSFDFEFQVIDRAKTSISSGTLSVGKPLMFLHTNGNLDIGSHTISNDGANYSGKAATAGTADNATNATNANKATLSNKLENINGRITNANIAHTYENNKSHLQLLIASNAMTSNKPASDGHILHCSWDNSGQYNGQLFIPNSNGNVPVQFRGCGNGTWGSWENLYRCKNLYNNTSGTSGTITLSESAANFTYFELLCKHQASGLGYYTIRIYSPNGKKVNIGDIGSDTTDWMVFHTTSYSISGTSMTKGLSANLAVNINNNPLGNGGHTHNVEILVYRVDGYR